MDIAYSTWSQFLKASEAAIRGDRADLDGGGRVYVDLGEGGYKGHVVVTIRQNHRASFGTNCRWTGSDPTAAATALLNGGCEEAFDVSHTDGRLAIRAV